MEFFFGPFSVGTFVLPLMVASFSAYLLFSGFRKLRRPGMKRRIGWGFFTLGASALGLWSSFYILFYSHFPRLEIRPAALAGALVVISLVTSLGAVWFSRQPGRNDGSTGLLAASPFLGLYASNVLLAGIYGWGPSLAVAAAFTFAWLLASLSIWIYKHKPEWLGARGLAGWRASILAGAAVYSCHAMFLYALSALAGRSITGAGGYTSNGMYVILLVVLITAVLFIIQLSALFFSDIRKLKQDRYASFQYRSLFKENSDAVIFTKPDGSIRHVNRIAISVFGLNNVSLGGKSIHSLFSPDSASALEDGLSEVRKGKGVHGYEAVLVNGAGQRWDVVVKHVPITIQSETMGIFTILSDITENKRVLIELKKTKYELESFFMNAREVLQIVDRDGKLRKINKAFEHLFGWKEEEVIGKIPPTISEEDVGEYLNRIARVFAGEKMSHYQGIALKRDGTERTIQLTMFPLKDESGQIWRAASIIQDVTEEEQLRRRLEESEKRYRSLAEYSSEYLVAITPGFEIKYTSPSVRAIFGSEYKKMFTREGMFGLSHADFSKLEEIVLQSAHSGHGANLECAVRLKERTMQVEALVTPIQADAGEVEELVLAFHDISERKRHEEELRSMAYKDGLTSLANRRALEEELEQYVSSAEPFAMLLLDFDKFKWINDQLSHRAGDEFLKDAAVRIRNCLPEGCFVARLGGDEFAVLLKIRTGGESEAKLTAERLVGEFQSPFRFNGQEVLSTLSVGIAYYPRHGETAQQLMHHADRAMYHVKERGKNGLQVYEYQQHRTELIEAALLQAVRDKQFHLEYLPKLVLDDMSILGVEALMRWVTPELGEIPPAEFIPVLEKRGLMEEMTYWAIETACKEMKEMAGPDFPPFYVAVNLSPELFKQEHMGETILTLLERIDFPANYLILEVTETAVMANIEQSVKILNELREAGIRLALDDFGTGVSSLHILKHLPISVLKIDKSFVDQIEESRKDKKIVSTIIELAQNLHFKVLAEGVETMGQLRILKELGCDYIQGYLISRPLPLSELKELVYGRPVRTDG